MKRTLSMLVVLSLFGFAGGAWAAILYKDATTTDLNTLANWSTTNGALTPDPTSFGTADQLRFNENTAASGTFTMDLSANLSVGDITVDSGAAGGGSATGDFVINSANNSTLTLNSGGNASYTSSGIVLNSGTGGTLTISAPIAIGSSTVRFTASRALTLNGTVSLGANTLEFNTAGASQITTLAGNISGTGGKLSKISGSAGTLILSGNNSFTGGTTISAGTLKLGHASALGTGALIVGAGMTFDNITGSEMTISNAFTLSGGSPTFTGSSDMTIGGAVTISGLAAGTTRTITVSASTLTLSGVIAESGGAGQGLTKAGTGTLTLSNINSSFTGQVSLAGGTTNVAKLAILGSNSSLGAGSASYTIRLNGGALNYNGAGGDTTDRTIQLAASGTINNNGNGTIDFTAASLTHSGTASARTLTLGGDYTGGANTFGSSIGDSGTGANITSLTKSGASTWKLTGANTYTGTTIVSAGTLRAGNDSAIGTGGLQMNGGGTFASDGGTARSFSNTLTLNGTGAATMTFGDATGTGDLTFTGTVATQGSGVNRNVVINNTTTTWSGTVTGSHTGMVLNKSGTGNLVISGTGNTYTGKTNVLDGTLSIASIANADGATASSLGKVAAAQGTIGIGSSTTSATLKYTGTGNITDRVIDLAGTTGGATLDQSGTGLLQFTSALTATGAGAKTLTLQGSTAGTGEIAGAIVDNGGSNTTALMKSGTGKWTLSGNNTYTGGTTISGGTLEIGGSGSLGSGTYAGAISNTGELKVSTSADQTLSGGISGTGGILTMSGTGTLTLSGNNSYTGGTTVNNGTLKISGNSATGSGAVTVKSGATLAGTGLITGLTTIENGATLSPGNSPGFEGYAGGLALNSTSTTKFELGGTARSDISNSGDAYYDAIDITGGTFTLDGTIQVVWWNGFSAAKDDSFQLFNWTGATLVDSGATFDFSGATLGPGLSWDTSTFGTDGTITVIPEPGTAGIVASFIAAALLRKRRLG